MPEYHVTPFAKVRMTQRDKWLVPPRPPVAKFRAYAERMRELKAQLKDWDSVVFTMPMPKSWSKKKRLEHIGKPCRSKPDLDNLLGGLMDAIMPDGDAHLCGLSGVSKVWGIDGKVRIGNPFELEQEAERKLQERNTALQLSAASASPTACPEKSPSPGSAARRQTSRP